MSRFARSRTRLRRLAASESVYVRRAPATIALVLAIGVVTGVLVATADKWSSILQGFAANVVAAVVLAVFAYVVFVLRFRRAKLAEYVDRYRPTGADRSDDDSRTAGGAWWRRLLRRSADEPPDEPLSRTVRELLKARPPRSCLFVSAADVARSAAMEEFPTLLAASRLVPVRVDLRHEQAGTSIPALARSRFVNELVGSAGDSAGAGRLFASLLGRRKLVAVVIGLDTWSEGMSMRARQDAVTELLQGCVIEHLPFVAAVPDELTPSIGEIAVLRIPSVSRAELAAHMSSDLKERGLEDDLEAQLRSTFAKLTEATRDPFYLDLAAELLMARVWRGDDAAEALADLFRDPRSFRRHLGWMCEWALPCELSEASTSPSPAALALATIGAETHYRQELPTTWVDASAALDADAARRFAAGVSILAQKDVLAVAGGGGASVLRFTHAGWSAFAGALGVGLDKRRWNDLLRPGAPQATLDALTAALVLDGGASWSGNPSFVEILEHLRPHGGPEISLDMAVAVIAALQVGDLPLVLRERELTMLEKSWRSSTDPVRLAFVTGLDFSRDPLLVEFLWRQVVPPAFQANSYRTRRAACERLASLGAVAWERLGAQWTELAKGARERDLSARMRRVLTDWQDAGLAVASLAWILPSLTLRLVGEERTDALALLQQLRAIAAEGWDASKPAPTVSDIGIEISLAEGFKIAGADVAGGDASADGWWYEEARELFDEAKSWVSRSVLLQAHALADDDGAEVRRLAERTVRAPRTHPFVRETAALALRALELDPHHVDRLLYVWRNDVQALDDGGLELAPEAHRLLALSTLLINLAERALAKHADGAAERDLALTSPTLPRCFCRRSHTATMLDYPCDCGFNICGREARGHAARAAHGEGGNRVFSRAFVKRAEATSRAPIRSSRAAFTRGAFRDIWRELDRELARGA